MHGDPLSTRCLHVVEFISIFHLLFSQLLTRTIQLEFANGRVEEFWAGHSLDAQSMHQPWVATSVASALANFHWHGPALAEEGQQGTLWTRLQQWMGLVRTLWGDSFQSLLLDDIDHTVWHLVGTLVYHHHTMVVVFVCVHCCLLFGVHRVCALFVRFAATVTPSRIDMLLCTGPALAGPDAAQHVSLVCVLPQRPPVWQHDALLPSAHCQRTITRCCSNPH